MKFKEAIAKAKSLEPVISAKAFEAIELLIENAKAFDQVWRSYQDLGQLWSDSMDRIEKLEQEAKIEIEKVRPDLGALGYYQGIIDSIKALNNDNPSK